MKLTARSTHPILFVVQCVFRNGRGRNILCIYLIYNPDVVTDNPYGDLPTKAHFLSLWATWSYRKYLIVTRPAGVAVAHALVGRGRKGFFAPLSTIKKFMISFALSTEGVGILTVTCSHIRDMHRPSTKCWLTPPDCTCRSEST